MRVWVDVWRVRVCGWEYVGGRVCVWVGVCGWEGVCVGGRV